MSTLSSAVLAVVVAGGSANDREMVSKGRGKAGTNQAMVQKAIISSQIITMEIT